METWKPEKDLVIEMNKGIPVKFINKPKGDKRSLSEVVSQNKLKPLPPKINLTKNEIIDRMVSEYADVNKINNTG